MMLCNAVVEGASGVDIASVKAYWRHAVKAISVWSALESENIDFKGHFAYETRGLWFMVMDGEDGEVLQVVIPAVLRRQPAGRPPELARGDQELDESEARRKLRA